MDEHLIGDGLWQRVLEEPRSEPYMCLNDLGRLRRFVRACFVVVRRNCTWAELGCFVPSAEAAKRRFRRWARESVWKHLFGQSQPLAGPDVLHVERRRLPDIDSIGDFAKRNADIKCRPTALGARGGAEEAVGRSRDRLTTKTHRAVDSLGFIRRLLTSSGQHACNAALYRTRHMVGNSFCRLKNHRRLSLRLDKAETSFRAFACFAAALMNLKLKLRSRP